MTGVDTSMLTMRRYVRTCRSMPLMLPKYMATANIITCIMPSPATIRRLSIA